LASRYYCFALVRVGSYEMRMMPSSTNLVRSDSMTSRLNEAASCRTLRAGLAIDPTTIGPSILDSSFWQYVKAS